MAITTAIPKIISDIFDDFIFFILIIHSVHPLITLRFLFFGFVGYGDFGGEEKCGGGAGVFDAETGNFDWVDNPRNYHVVNHLVGKSVISAVPLAIFYFVNNNRTIIFASIDSNLFQGSF